MSSDRLARMKAERERARGIIPQQGQGQLSPQQPAQDQPQYSQQPQQAAYNEPQMHPAGGMGMQPQQQQGALSGGNDYNQAGPAGYGQQQQHPQYSQQQPQQMGGAIVGDGQQQQYQQPQQQGYANGNAGGNDMNAFFGEIDNISSELDTLKRNIDRIGNLHNTVLNSTVNEQRQEQAQSELTQLTQETSRLTNNLKFRIKNLSEQNDKIPSVPGNESDKNTRRMQVAAQKKKFMDLIQEYRLVEQKSRERYRSRMERQYKIVKPDATEAEIKQAIETDQGTQVFANALTQSTRYADARNAYREVQERHEDIKRIAQTMTELQELFNDMAMLVERQDEAIMTIEASAQDVEQNMEGGHKEIERGVIKARRARKKRIWCFWILVILIIVIALVVTLSILSKNGTI
ncbi:t-SNARE [Cystobasidium minutum MCA 4210]|uniref:t-SNARE n=1 Tax=Cystobasidium minutum MCA 4210 TaxID=1397322 RepID=UPI0034CE9F18|eukprot:jgi/Rhomi1/32101/CE32100_8136